ncbi:MAG: toxin secretion/phage lysis holin [Clostridiaceae bacterium]|nr:toxin secretion/phage lysis holin [Clostridiaceae bacterium]
MSGREFINSIIAIPGGIFNYIFGGWDTTLKVLIILIIVDYGTGITNAAIKNKLSSKKGYIGIAKKALILVVIIVPVLLDRLLNNGAWIFRTLVCYFYIANEGISILDNIGKCGVPLPQKLLSTLEQLKKKENS